MNNKIMNGLSEKDNDFLEKINNMPISTKVERERKEQAFYYFNRKEFSGRYGAIQELLSCTKNSKKNRVSKQGSHDSFIRWRSTEGKVSNRPIEVKTNGGRIGELIKRLENGKDTIIVYSMDICNSSTKGVRRELHPRIMWFSDFFDILKECNAIKNTNGKKPELAIQASSKKLFEALGGSNFTFYYPTETYQTGVKGSIELA